MIDPIVGIESFQTYKTDITSNKEFLSIIFRDCPNEIKPICVSFPGNPHDTPKYNWAGIAWNGQDDFNPSEHNNYFSLSAFRSDECGNFRRQKKHFSALYCLMLDDVGSKIPFERVTLNPSWFVETSEGNYQFGYILTTPISDWKIADKLMKEIIANGLCDPGASGPTARIARLPIGINGKNDSTFVCEGKWEIGLYYNIEEIIDVFELNMSLHLGKKASNQQKKKPNQSFYEDHFIPKSDINPVIAAAKKIGIYKSNLGEGKHDLICPWLSDHTDGVDGGTAYFEPNDEYRIGGFKCFHGHCADRKISDLLKFLNVEKNIAQMIPVIRCIPGQIHISVDNAEKVLASSKKYYQRGGQIITVGTDPATQQTSVKQLTQPSLTNALSRLALWEKYSLNHGWISIDPPLRTVSVLLEAINYSHLPILNGLACQPYIREDGSLMSASGYDEETGMFGVFDDAKFDIPLNPSRKQAEEAVNSILYLLAEFPFKGEADKAAALSAILTAAIRPSLPLAPMFHLTAPQIGSGKSFLCEMIGCFATPKKGSPNSFPQDDEECRKLLLSELLIAPPVIEFDNLTNDLVAHNSLCTALTSEHLTGRILGVSKTATVNTRALFLSSGNNVSPVNDMIRRCVVINLDAKCEIPAARVFKDPNILNILFDNRERYVSQALTIILAWINAGRPLSDCKSIVSYGRWTELCRQPLLWLGFTDPAESMMQAFREDPDRELLGRLLVTWNECFGSRPTMIREAIGYSGPQHLELKDILEDIGGDKSGVNKLIIGRWINRRAARIVDGYKFTKGDGRKSAVAWKVESVT